MWGDGPLFSFILHPVSFHLHVSFAFCICVTLRTKIIINVQVCDCSLVPGIHAQESAVFISRSFYNLCSTLGLKIGKINFTFTKLKNET